MSEPANEMSSKLTKTIRTCHWDAQPVYNQRTQSFSHFLEDLELRMKLDLIDDDNAKLAILKLKLPYEVRDIVNEVISDKKISTYAALTLSLKIKLENEMGIMDAQVKLRTFKLDFSKDKFKASLEEFCRTIKYAFPNMDSMALLTHTCSMTMNYVKGRLWERLYNHSHRYESISEMIMDLNSANQFLNEKETSQSKIETKFNGRCNWCNFKGHKENMCRKKKAGLPKGEFNTNKDKFKTTEKEDEKLYRICQTGQKNIVLPILVNETKSSGLLDSGAEVTITTKRYAEKLNAKTTYSKKPLKLTVGNGTTWVSCGECILNLEIANLAVRLPVYLFEEEEFNKACCEPILLGIDFLESLSKYTINHVNNTIKINGQFIKFISEDKGEDHIVNLKENKSMLRAQIMKNSNEVLMNKLKGKFPNIFSEKLGRINIEPVDDLELVKELPKIVKYSYNPETNDLIRKEVDKMFDQGILTLDNDVEYISNFTLAKKKNGKVRPCVDLRRLNSAIKARVTILPEFGEIIRKIAGKSSYFSNSFLQIPIGKRMQKYLAVFTYRGIAKFTRLPFGYINSTYIWNNTLENILGPIYNLNVVSYVDDVLGFAASHEELWNLALKLLSSIEERGGRLNLEKSKFFCTEITYLAHDWGHFGYRPTLSATKRMIEYPRPKNRTETRRFLGMIAFYRRHVKNLYLDAGPIINLIKKSVEFKWTSQCEESFKLLKERLTSREILSAPRFGDLFILFVDGSQHGAGSMLMQYKSKEHEKKDNEKYEFKDMNLIAYFSKRFQKEKLAKAATVYEMKALVLSIEHFKDIISAQKLLVVSDHRCLKQVLNHNSSPRYVNLISIIAGYNIELVYKAGARLEGPDALSRLLRIRNGGDTQETEKDKDNYMKKLFKECHDDMSHLGYKKSIDLLRTRLPNVKFEKEYLDYLKKCTICQTSNRRKKLNYKQETIFSSYPMEMLSMDLIGKLNASQTGTQYIAVAVDNLTRFVWLKGISTCTSNEIIDFLDEIISVFGICANIKTDGQTCFTSTVFKDYCEMLGISKHIAIRGHHNGNSICERMIGSVNLCMRRMEEKFFNKFDELLPQIMYSLNNTIHPAIDTSPHELMFGWSSLIPADLKKFHDQPLDKIVNYNQDKNLRLLAFEMAQEILTNIKAGEKDDKLTEKLRSDIKVNDMVMIKNHNPNDNINQKFKPIWTPGYTVKKIFNNCYYVAPIIAKRGRHKRVHIQDIKKAIS
ncbi:Reverse transcriptase domain and Integrase, catalytic core domain and Ribonuclease H-like domain and Aspartic peptidase domain-containing protein [Strongyloides ratti]|uniref:RNA-directed DNA polymerase n=1 Tax=Strongyloides ratti TaxID=34506 RepID=A0A090KVV6_STRRB|nr:Reverse transcriptase domain and Integrase, catalytic core domain and Ribonuclease H-like domain and Aspartic peptidase domain-containing protein [Strongyloides ratti]CEF61630.1 Reverse transcriptase domain and Integrase, catalytic core domain and Ribonuclease H-like domain and Aspartic peptidase domain-containing protein [Strongyloides ratti]